MWAAARAEKAADHILGIVSSFVPSDEKPAEEVVSEVPLLEPVQEEIPF